MTETLTTQDWQKFFHRYGKFTGNNVELRTEEFKARFGHLRTALHAILRLSNELKKEQGGDFNLFHLLGVERREVTTHSALLADLLNPRGTHCQDVIFLEAFLRYCSQKFDDFFLRHIDVIQNYTWFVDKEKVTVFGNLDIVVSCPELKFLLVIENKIDAGEQPKQLMRYAQWMEGQKEHFANRALIYLTPHGSKSFTTYGADYYRLSYRQDIVGWLRQALVEVKASRVKEMILQYIEVAETL